VVAGLRVISTRNLRRATSFLEGQTDIAPAQVELPGSSTSSPTMRPISPRPKGMNRSGAPWKSPPVAATTSSCCEHLTYTVHYGL